jgi:hypothetical protein
VSTDPETPSSPRWVDRGSAHREHVLSCIAKLWEKHPENSFCDLVHFYVISIGTMAGHTSDEDVVESCRAGSSGERR